MAFRTKKVKKKASVKKPKPVEFTGDPRNPGKLEGEMLIAFLRKHAPDDPRLKK